MQDKIIDTSTVRNRCAADSTPPPRRPGRPRLADREGRTQGDDDESTRKARARLAQRRYRSKREQALSSAQDRVARLEVALEKTQGIFDDFHRFALGGGASRSHMMMSPEALVRLSKAAVEMTSVTREVRRRDATQEGGLDGDEEEIWGSRVVGEGLDSPGSYPHPRHLSQGMAREQDVPKRPTPAELQLWGEQIPPAVPISRACVERAFRMLAQQPIGDTRLPTVLVPLQLYDAAGFHHISHFLLTSTFGLSVQLLQQRQRQYPLLGSPPIPGLPPGADAASVPRANMPKLYRVVEGVAGEEEKEQAGIQSGIGGAVAAPRSAPPFLQRLRFGRTRTRVLDSVPELEGEWLEATDVLEYLEERGISLRRQQQPARRQQQQEVYYGSDNSSSSWPAAENMAMALDTPGPHPHLPPPPSRAKLTINLEVLVQRLASMAVCIGPAAAIRKGAVDLAIRDAMISLQMK